MIYDAEVEVECDIRFAKKFIEELTGQDVVLWKKWTSHYAFMNSKKHVAIVSWDVFKKRFFNNKKPSKSLLVQLDIRRK